jgi:hypothetical protein
MAKSETVRVKDAKTGVIKNFPKDTFERHMQGSTFMGKKRFTLVGANESQAQTANVKATAPVEKKKPVAASAEEGAQPESASDKFLREHKERNEGAANPENQTKTEE